MHILDLIGPDRIKCHNSTGSKKRVLEQLSQLLAEHQPDLLDGEVFDGLLNRERLGSTGFGKGVAIPHCRVSGLKVPVAAFVKLDRGIDFDAMDDQPVDLVFGLLVPADSSEEHLQLLAQLAQLISQPNLLNSLRQETDPGELHKHLNHRYAENMSA